MNKIIQIIADELNVKEEQVTNTIKLIDDGNTIPFIARYRKERTGVCCSYWTSVTNTSWI